MKSVSLAFSKNIKLFLILLIIGIFIVILVKNISLFVPFVISFIFAFLLSPFVNFLESYGIRRTVAVILIFLLIFCASYILVKIFLPVIINEIDSFKEEFPSYIQSIKKNTNDFLEYVKRLEKQNEIMGYLNLSKSLKKEINTITDYKIRDIVSNITGGIEQALSSLMSLIMEVIIVLFLTFFMLRDGIKIRKALIRMVPNRYFEMALSVHHEIDRQLRNYFKGILLEAFIVSIIASIGFYIVGLKYALIAGILTGIFNMITFLGPFITAFIVALIAIISSGSFILVLKSLIALVIVQLIDEILYPTIIGKSIDFHPILIIFAITIGGYTMGIIGVLLAVPIFSSVTLGIKFLLKGFREYRV